jgi:hypothetical protein
LCEHDCVYKDHARPERVRNQIIHIAIANMVSTAAKDRKRNAQEEAEVVAILTPETGKWSAVFLEFEAMSQDPQTLEEQRQATWRTGFRALPRSEAPPFPPLSPGCYETACSHS